MEMTGDHVSLSHGHLDRPVAEDGLQGRNVASRLQKPAGEGHGGGRGIGMVLRLVWRSGRICWQKLSTVRRSRARTHKALWCDGVCRQVCRLRRRSRARYAEMRSWFWSA